MRKSILITLLWALASTNLAFADTIVHHCDAESFDKKNNWGYLLKVHCCNPKVTTCSSQDALITQSPGRISIGANKSHNLTVQCDGNWYRVNKTTHNQSGGNIVASENGGANNATKGQYSMRLHNSSSTAGQAWINGFYCE